MMKPICEFVSSLIARGLIARGLIARGLIARGLIARGLITVLACLSLTLSVALADDEATADGKTADAASWTDDAHKALTEAKKEKKDVLVNFTGSDWCPYCISLHDEVFKLAEFKKWAKDHFVLLELDFPSDPSGQSDLLRDQNNLWLRRFNVQGFPSVYLCDSEGLPYAKTGYQEGGVPKYIAHLVELKRIRKLRDQELAKAEKAKGADKAQYLDNALMTMDPSLIRQHYKSFADQIAAAGDQRLSEKYEDLMKLSNAPVPQTGPEEEWLSDPFGFLGADMKSASNDLKDKKTQPPVDETHPRIENRLAQLIEMMEKSSKSSGSGGGSKNPSRPAQKSTLRSGDGKVGDLRDPAASRKKWAQLTPKEREKILQSKNEGFPAEFDDVLADYFRRIAREAAAGTNEPE
jgi:thioredoxin-related protein